MTFQSDDIYNVEIGGVTVSVYRNANGEIEFNIACGGDDITLSHEQAKVLDSTIMPTAINRARPAKANA